MTGCVAAASWMVGRAMTKLLNEEHADVVLTSSAKNGEKQVRSIEVHMAVKLYVADTPTVDRAHPVSVVFACITALQKNALT